MLRGQLFQCFFQSLPKFRPARRFVRITLAAWQPSQFVLSVLASEDVVSTLTPPEIDRKVGGDPIEPSRKARPRLEVLKIFKSSNKGFLSQLQRIILIMDYR